MKLFVFVDAAFDINEPGSFLLRVPGKIVSKAFGAVASWIKNHRLTVFTHLVFELVLFGRFPELAGVVLFQTG